MAGQSRPESSSTETSTKPAACGGATTNIQMYLAFATGVAFWMIYGFMIWNWAMIIANAITLGLTVAIITMKLRYG